MDMPKSKRHDTARNVRNWRPNPLLCHQTSMRPAERDSLLLSNTSPAANFALWSSGICDVLEVESHRELNSARFSGGYDSAKEGTEVGIEKWDAIVGMIKQIE